MRNKENTFYIKIKWVVNKWKQIWRTIGFPTANFKFDSDIILEEWTFKINWIIDNKVYSWAWVFLWKDNLFEAHFIDYSWDLYWKKIEVIIFYKIRDNIAFSSLEELKTEIKNDLDYIKSNPDHVLTFGTFDTFHLWHQFYLEQSKLYWDKLVTIVAKSSNVKKFKWKKPKFDELKRVEMIKKSWIPDIIELWDSDNPLKWIELYNPKVICIWYDQKWFVSLLENHILNNNLNIKIIRIKPFNEDKFKSSIINETF